jgi:hypothetical protein
MHFMAFAQQNGSLKSGDALKQKNRWTLPPVLIGLRRQ